MPDVHGIQHQHSFAEELFLKQVNFYETENSLPSVGIELKNSRSLSDGFC